MSSAKRDHARKIVEVVINELKGRLRWIPL